MLEYLETKVSDFIIDSCDVFPRICFPYFFKLFYLPFISYYWKISSICSRFLYLPIFVKASSNVMNYSYYWLVYLSNLKSTNLQIVDRKLYQYPPLFLHSCIWISTLFCKRYKYTASILFVTWRSAKSSLWLWL